MSDLAICSGCGRGTDSCWCPDDDLDRIVALQDERNAAMTAEILRTRLQRVFADTQIQALEMSLKTREAQLSGLRREMDALRAVCDRYRDELMARDED